MSKAIKPSSKVLNGKAKKLAAVQLNVWGYDVVNDYIDDKHLIVKSSQNSEMPNILFEVMNNLQNTTWGMLAEDYKLCVFVFLGDKKTYLIDLDKVRAHLQTMISGHLWTDVFKKSLKAFAELVGRPSFEQGYSLQQRNSDHGFYILVPTKDLRAIGAIVRE